jgi:hypothetical protein
VRDGGKTQEIVCSFMCLGERSLKRSLEKPRARSSSCLAKHLSGRWLSSVPWQEPDKCNGAHTRDSMSY